MPAIEGLCVRRAQSVAEYDACEEIQRRAWGYQDIDIVPTNELISVAKSGGLVLCAFLGERVVGFCFGLVGRDHDTGVLYHYSRMVGVDPELRGRGVGQTLKQEQRRAVLEQGLRSMRWTFDPLAAENATLNLAKLGAEAVAYLPDLYGPGTTSPLHAGLGTDRLLVEWRLDAPRRHPTPGAPRIAVPPDLAALRRAPAEAAKARARVRAEFEKALADGLVAVDFQDASYILAKRDPA